MRRVIEAYQADFFIFTRAAPIKRTAVEHQVNLQIVFLFILLLALSVGSTIGSSIRTWFFSSSQWYLFESTSLSGRGESDVHTGSQRLY